MKRVLKITGMVLLVAILAGLVWNNVQTRKKLDEYVQENQQLKQTAEIEQRVEEKVSPPQEVEVPVVAASQSPGTSKAQSENKTPVINAPVKKSPTCAKCGNVCFEGHKYCSSHECKEPRCEELNVANDYWGYCYEHKCALCDDSVSFGSRFCYSHGCRSCDEPAVKGSDYCVEHKCALCDDRAGFDGFCFSHD